ncbi:MAG: hypothetical protein IKS41_04210 [Alphaproteobacteria bacterium]|nr:hypothetical protein [Alphaproteobacteria bacterium]
MTKKQILGFIKAPFSKSFIIAYLFSFFSLLVVPLISNAISAIFSKLNEIEKLSQDEAIKRIFGILKDQISYADVIAAVVGICIFIFLLSLYYFLLVHKTVVEKKDIFEASQISLKISEILSVTFKYLGFLLIFLSGFLLPILFTAVLVLIGTLLPTILTVIISFSSFFLFFFLLYKMICHLYTASLIFYKEFKLSVFFDRKRVKAFFIDHKQNIFISFLLSYVAGQMVYVIYSSICFNLLQKIFSIGLILEVFHLSGQIITAIGLCIFNFAFTYLTILQAIIFGKIILWVEKSGSNK